MNQQQKKYLRDLASAVYRNHSSALYAEKEVMPAAVKRASALVGKWRSTANKKQEARRDALRDADAKVAAAVLFGTPDEALAAIDKFKKQRF